MGRIARALFSFSGEQARFNRALRERPAGPFRRRLEEIALGFASGYHAALEEDTPESLAARLSLGEPELDGFVYEGAGLGLAILDTLTPWRRNRLVSFARGAGSHQVYMLHVGAGWALGRLPAGMPAFLSRLDPLLGWLSLDGYGFHEAFYRWSFTVERQRLPSKISGYAVHPFDAGVGRSLWFTPEVALSDIPKIIARFPAWRQASLWSGVGEACAFAAGRDPRAAVAMREAAGPQAAALAQGAAFAAQVRERGGNPAPHTDEACKILCGMDAASASALADLALTGAAAEGATPAFEIWRRRLRNLLGPAVLEAQGGNLFYNQPQ